MSEETLENRRKKGSCCYQLPADATIDPGKFVCSARQANGRDFCIAHTKDRTPEEEKAFAALIKKKLDEKDYNFTGYFFPEAFKVFEGRTFAKTAQFDYACFDGGASFDEAKFGGDAWFADAKFGGKTSFLRGEFDSDALFHRTRFAGAVAFLEARFGGGTWFDEANFGCAA